jgi:rhodanese-related sulfurtransferase
MERFAEFAANNAALFFALGVVLGLIVYNEIRARLRGFKNLSVSEALLKVNHDDALLLDTREDNEYREGHIVNARHIPLSKLAARADELNKFKHRPIIAYCRSGNRSSTACAILKKAGYEEVYNLGGGILAWQNADLPVTKK